MIERRTIEALLKVNGITSTAKEEEIRSVLISARWNENEIGTAFMVLKDNITSKETHVDTLNKVFNSDNRLTSAEITSLLGIDVHITRDDVENLEYKRVKSERVYGWLTFFLAIVIALGIMSYFMYVDRIGYFSERT